jgi:uncharacterized MAPEG superfamily protein
MTTELQYLTWYAAFMALMWVPYILNMIAVRGLVDAVGYPADPKPLAPWAQRLKAAHANAVENMVVFAPLILIAHVLVVSNGVTVTCAAVFFWARVVHAVVYALAIPWLRTLSFAIGWAAMVGILFQIL